MGDLNAKIEKDESGKIYPVSKNGSLLCEIVNESNLEVMNMTEKCVGKWTHVIRTTGETSRLDYVLADTRTEKMIKNMIIDESTLLQYVRFA